MNTERITTTPPGRYVLLYDGACPFCEKQSKRLVEHARRGATERRSFREPGVLDRFPGVTREMCEEAMQLIAPEGLVYSAFEAAVRAFMTRPILGKIVLLYYIPGIRQLCEFIYRWIARHRYAFGGKVDESCDAGACALHGTKAEADE